jgi:hypothetical protein
MYKKAFTQGETIYHYIFLFCQSYYPSILQILVQAFYFQDYHLSELRFSGLHDCRIFIPFIKILSSFNLINPTRPDYFGSSGILHNPHFLLIQSIQFIHGFIYFIIGVLDSNSLLISFMHHQRIPGCCWRIANIHQPSDYSKRTFIKDFYFIKPRFLRHGLMKSE